MEIRPGVGGGKNVPWNSAHPHADPLRQTGEGAEESLRQRSLNSKAEAEPQDPELREAFRDFVGQTLFGQMMSAMRKTQEGPAYMDGGQAERMFQQQLDQALVEEVSEASAGRVADPMFELFMLHRPQ